MSMFLSLLSVCFLNALDIPRLQSPINDQAGIFSSKFKNHWNQDLKNLYEREDIQIAILSLSSLSGISIEEAGIKIVDEWQLGKKGSDKGLLVLIAMRERQVRIEVGRGLEGDLPDVTAKRIIEDIMMPYFRRTQFESGVDESLRTIYSILGLGSPSGGSRKRHIQDDEFYLDFFIFLILFVLAALLSIIRRRTYHGDAYMTSSWGGPRSHGGYSGRGFGGFGGGIGGGGGFSGGGASGSW